MALFKFNDLTLFGSEAADLEEKSLFFSYAVHPQTLGHANVERIVGKAAVALTGA